MRSIRALFSVALVLAGIGGAAAAPPELVRYQARLTDDAGVPLSGQHDLAFAIHDAASGGAQCWGEVHGGLTLENGTVDVLLGAITPLPSVVFTDGDPLCSGTDRWLAIAVDGSALAPRQRLASVPFAHTADRLGGEPASYFLDTSAVQQTKSADIEFIDGGNPVIRNPNNPNASVQLSWYNDGSEDFSRIRYGGAGAGGGSGFLIQGSNDETFLKIDEANQRVEIGSGGNATVFDDGSADFDAGGGHVEINRYVSGNVPSLWLTNGVATNDWVIYSEDASTSDLYIVSRNASADVQIAGQSAFVANLEVDGDVIASNVQPSSIRWKEGIQEIPDALARIRQLRGVSFDWKETGKHDIGMIAEEVGQVLREAVKYEADGENATGIYYSRIVPVLVEAVKAQQRLIEEQGKRIEGLERALLGKAEGGF
jgi:hypothetical protein